MQLDVHSVCIASLKLIQGRMLSGNEIYHVDKNMKFQIWATMLSEKREASFSSQHGDTVRVGFCITSLKVVCHLAGGNKIAVPTNTFGINFTSTSQIANNL